MSDKQDKTIAIIAAAASIGVLIYMAMRKAKGAAGSGGAIPQGVGSGPSSGNPYSGALGFLGPVMIGPSQAVARAGQPFGSVGPSMQVQASGAMNGNAMFPLFGYAVTTGTTQGIAQILQALMNENAAYQGFTRSNVVPITSYMRG